MWSLIARIGYSWRDLAQPLLTRDRRLRREIRLRRKYVKAGGRYRYASTGLALLLPRSRQRVFQWRLQRDARRISTRKLEELLRMGWREATTASWLIAAGRRTDLRDQLARFLYADSSADLADLALALACLGGEQDAQLLTAYLRKALTPEAEADGQVWSLAALLYLDDRLGTARAQEFLGADGAWERWASPGEQDLKKTRHEFEQLVLLMEGGKPDSRERFVRDGVYSSGWRGWWQPPFQ